MKDSMKPVDVGAPVLIPQADLGEHPGSYGGMRRALDAVRAGSILYGYYPSNEVKKEERQLLY